VTVYRLFPATNGPASPAAYSGPILLGVLFKATQGGMWFDGYWLWVANSGQSTAPQKCALWQLTGTGVGILITGSAVTSGTLTAGQWNYVPLAAPLPLSVGTPYNACTGWDTTGTTGFPDTANQFGAGQVYQNGIVNGPLSAYSDQGANLPAPFSTGQGVFSVAGSDPAANMPGSGSSSSNFWVDLQLDTAAPAGASYRLWPNLPVPPNIQLESSLNFTLATEFKLSAACTLGKIWFYSPPTATQLPTEAGIWNVATQQLVAGTHLSTPSWSGAAASGWVSASYGPGVVLPAGDYKTSVFNGAGTPGPWASNTVDYWDTGPGSGGITTGPLSAPNLAGAASPGQGTFHQGVTFAWPDTYTGSPAAAQTYWADVEVTPVPPAPQAPPGGGGSSMLKRRLMLADL
jgi:hypothetical protein